MCFITAEFSGLCLSQNYLGWNDNNDVKFPGVFLVPQALDSITLFRAVDFSCIPGGLQYYHMELLLHKQGLLQKDSYSCM